MELLLLLTAMFASLAGAVGERGTAGQVQGVAVVRAAQAVQAAAQPVRQALPAAALPTGRVKLAVWTWLAAEPVRNLRLVFERRLE